MTEGELLRDDFLKRKEGSSIFKTKDHIFDFYLKNDYRNVGILLQGFVVYGIDTEYTRHLHDEIKSKMKLVKNTDKSTFDILGKYIYQVEPEFESTCKEVAKKLIDYLQV